MVGFAISGKFIVPFSAGGPADTAARTFAEMMRKHFSQPVVVENRPAAGGIPGTEYVVQNGQDGYTLLLGGIAGLALIPPVQKVRYSVDDFAPLGLIWRSPQVFAVRNGLPVKSAAEFVTYAKANPDKLTFGSAGIGTVTHLAGELLQREAAITLIHVPFRSTVNSLTDLIGGHIDAIFGDVAILQPHVQESMGVLALVGSGMRGAIGVAERMFAALAGERINVAAIAQGSSETNISVVIEESSLATGVRAVHRALVESKQLQAQ